MRSFSKLRRMGLVALGVFAGGLLAVAPALAAAPAVEGESVPYITPFEARLEGVVNAGEESTECYFQYGKTSVSENPLVSCEQAIVEGGEQGVGLTVKGLQAKTLYHYRVLVKNATSEAEGTGEFTTLTPVKPAVEGDSVLAKATEATLEAQINPNYQSTTYTFEYATNKALTGATTVAGKAALEGFGAQSASVSTGTVLQAGETYYYRVVAKNGTGDTDGPVDTFTTVPAPVTAAPTNITGVGAVFNGHFTLIPVDTKYSFEYKIGSECGGEDSTPTVDAGVGDSEVVEIWEVPSPEVPGVFAAAPPLTPSSQYSVCMVTSNAYGSQVGPPVHFTTPVDPPVVDGEAAVSVSTTGAILAAAINPNVQETAYAFEYSTQGTDASGVDKGALEGTIATVNGETALPAQDAELSVSVKSDPLQPRTTYYYRVMGTYAGHETVYGPVESFTTLGAPIVTTGEAQQIARTTATFSGTVNPGGAETNYYFEYISEAGYQAALARGAANPYAEGETTAPAGVGSQQQVETGTVFVPSLSYEPQAVSPVVAYGMLPETTYHYAIVATSTSGATVGQDETVRTLGRTVPTVTTGAVSGIAQNAATLSGTVGTNNLKTDYGFEIGTEPGNYGPATGLGSISGSLTETITLTVGELQPGTTYYYRVTATNADGTSYGETETFSTPAFPTLVKALAAPPLVATPAIAFPTGSQENTGTVTTKGLTNAQKLAKALKACAKEPKKQRAACQKQARKRYGAAKNTKKK
jgi:phosphodiesterase/alkaline phosphatase D-like protein